MPDHENFNQLFEHIFVITIERNRARRPLIDEQLKQFRFTYFEGVDAGKDTSDLTDLRDRFSCLVRINRNLTSKWSSGQTGCWLSHLTLLKKIVDEKLDRVVVLEDDIVLKEDRYNESFRSLRSVDWNSIDILYLGYTGVCAVNQKIKNHVLRNLYRIYYCVRYHRRTPKFFLVRKTFRHTLKCFSKAINRDFDSAGYFYGTHAYVVTYQGAKKILELYKEIKIPVDMSYAEAVVSGRLRGIALNRQLFFQNKELPSSII
ncbi:glycosyltransferase family 25 protein [Lacibacter sp. H375]|uniref:glycosyltransferase family 25 protein n=1 Tax=Lacibacter sp. H375 TaxID=3133424 RepID=UPI0030BA8B29